MDLMEFRCRICDKLNANFSIREIVTNFRLETEFGMLYIRVEKDFRNQYFAYLSERLNGRPVRDLNPHKCTGKPEGFDTIEAACEHILWEFYDNRNKDGQKNELRYDACFSPNDFWIQDNFKTKY